MQETHLLIQECIVWTSQRADLFLGRGLLRQQGYSHKRFRRELHGVQGGGLL
jgi:hypothetical protein